MVPSNLAGYYPFLSTSVASNKMIFFYCLLQAKRLELFSAINKSLHFCLP